MKQNLLRPIYYFFLMAHLAYPQYVVANDDPLPTEEPSSGSGHSVCKNDGKEDPNCVSTLKSKFSSYIGAKKHLYEYFSGNEAASGFVEESSSASAPSGLEFSSLNSLTNGKCSDDSDPGECFYTQPQNFAKTDADQTGHRLVTEKIKSDGSSGSGSSISNASGASGDFAICPNIYNGGIGKIRSRQDSDIGWFNTDSSETKGPTSRISKDIRKSIEQKSNAAIESLKNSKIFILEKLNNETCGQDQACQKILATIRDDENSPKWMEYLRDRIKIAAADKLMTFIRTCEAAYYLTSFEDPLEEEAESSHSSGMGAYGQITCKNTDPLLTQDYKFCKSVASAYDAYTIMEVAAVETSNIAGSAITTIGQAKALQTASANPGDPTLALFELQKQTEAQAVSATTQAGIQAAMGGYLKGVAGKFWELEDFVMKCEESLPRESAFGYHVYKEMFEGTQLENCGNQQACNETAFMDTKNHGPSLIKKYVSTSANVFLNYFLGSKFNSISAKDSSNPPNGEDKREYTGAKRSPPNVDEPTKCSNVSSGDPQTPDEFFCAQAKSFNHCAQAASSWIGGNVLAPNGAIKAVAAAMGTQALAKSAVSAAAATAYFAQVASIKKMIEDLNNKMEGIDMAGLADDLLTIQECQLNPSLPQCGGYGFTDGSTGFGDWGSLSMDTGSSSTMGNAAAGDSSDDDGSSASSDSGESLSATDAYASFAGTDANEAAASRASIKDGKGPGGSGGGSASAPGAPGGGGGASAGSSGSGGGGGSFGKSLDGKYALGVGSSWGGGTGRKSSQSLDEAIKGSARGSVLDYRGPAGINDDSMDIWKRISKGYSKARDKNRLLEYVED